MFRLETLLIVLCSLAAFSQRVLPAKLHCIKGCKPKTGVCVAPDECDCSLNFGGPDCGMQCPPLTFGPNCEHDCACLTNLSCNSNYTLCDCSQPQPVLRGTMCGKICKCRRTTCRSGWLGNDCNVPCKKNTCGFYCSKNCTCVQANTMFCTNEGCDCICKENFHGPNCEHHCPGTLKCLNKYLRLQCTCEETLEQEVRRLKSENKQMEKAGAYLLLGLVFLLLLKLILFMHLCRVRRKNRRIKTDLNFIVNYAKQAGRTNPIRQSDARTDGGSTVSSSFKKAELRTGHEPGASDNDRYATVQSFSALRTK